MNEEDYNWSLIGKISVPISIVIGYLFRQDLSDFLRWLTLVVGVIASGVIMYTFDKKKANIFTAMGLVILLSTFTLFAKRMGWF